MCLSNVQEDSLRWRALAEGLMTPFHLLSLLATQHPTIFMLGENRLAVCCVRNRNKHYIILSGTALPHP